MAKNYLHIPAVGQLDNTSCWAACLKWFWLATRNVYKSQKGLILKYGDITDDWGALELTQIQSVIDDQKMTREVFPNGTSFTVDSIREHLDYSPLFVAYTKTSTGTNHVNVIYGVSGTGNNAFVAAMEPDAGVKANNLNYNGKHMAKQLSEYNQLGPVTVGSLMASV